MVPRTFSLSESWVLFSLPAPVLYRKPNTPNIRKSANRIGKSVTAAVRFLVSLNTDMGSPSAVIYPQSKSTDALHTHVIIPTNSGPDWRLANPSSLLPGSVTPPCFFLLPPHLREHSGSARLAVVFLATSPRLYYLWNRSTSAPH